MLTHIVNSSGDDHISILLGLKDTEESPEAVPSRVTLARDESLGVGSTGELGTALHR